MGIYTPGAEQIRFKEQSTESSVAHSNFFWIEGETETQ